MAFSGRNKLLALAGWGGYAAPHLPLAAILHVTNSQVPVSTPRPAPAAQEMAQLVMVPLALQLRTVPGVTEIPSLARFGPSVLPVVLPRQPECLPDPAAGSREAPGRRGRAGRRHRRAHDGP